ncbi:aldo/keto reductase [Rothia sp. CCM 9419]|uniref:aldo/keto reductase n=1 Tax=Rothia sp. CCM 9419 TaxID=3402662 RepID=UPI003AE58399
MAQQPLKTFNDGHTIPQLGYGLWQVENDRAEEVTQLALDAGYRHIDTAKIYGNETGVGRALASSHVAREDIFVTTKIWNDDQGYDQTLRACEESLERLGLKSVDLLLIHWASIHREKYVQTWEAFIELRRRGLVRSIGVSNFPEQQLREIIEVTGVTPAIHQIELHPYFSQEKLRAVHQELGILTEAWSPLGQGGQLLSDPVITEIAQKHQATPAQVVIAWHLALGNVVIPKSVTPERIVSNFESLQVRLDDADIEAINSLTRADGRIGPDPSHIEF